MSLSLSVLNLSITLYVISSVIPSVWSDCHHVCLSPHLSVIPSVFYQSICLSPCLFVSHPSVCHPIYHPICLSATPSVCHLICLLSPCLSVCHLVCQLSHLSVTHLLVCHPSVPVTASICQSPICLSVTQVASELPGLPLIRANFWSSLIFEGPRFAQCLGIVCLETSAFWLPGGSWLSSPALCPGPSHHPAVQTFIDASADASFEASHSLDLRPEISRSNIKKQTVCGNPPPNGSAPLSGTEAGGNSASVFFFTPHLP